MTTIKITELTNIGANLNGNTLVPVVNMNGTPVTQRSNVENLANYVLNTGTGANLGAVGNITITGGTDGYVLQTDGTGNLSWVAQSGGGNGTPGGANTQIQFNDAGSFGGDSGLTFNKTTNDLTVAGNIISTDGNVTANWVIGDYVSGNATPLHHIPGANVTGAVSFATTANAVAAANVSGLGNIATVNLDGNSSNILYGNGVFDSIPNPFNQDLNTTDNVTFANITSTDAIRFSNSSNIVGALGYAPTYVSIEGYGGNAVNITANDVHTWSFGNTGSLTTPGPIYLPGGIGIEDDDGSLYVAAPGDAILSAGVTDGNGSVFLRTNQETQEWEFSADGNLTVPGNIISTVATGLTLGSNYDVYIVADRTDNNRTWKFDGSAGELILPNNGIIDPTDDNFEVRGIQNVNFEANATVNIYTDSGNNGFQWQFGDDGNLTLPGNTFSVNYANGVQVSIGGGGNASALVNGDNSFVLDADGNVVFEGNVAGQGIDRGLVWDYGANANGVNSMVRQDMNGITVRAWTEQGGGANGYSAPVRIVTNQDATENVWLFGGEGNLTLPGNLNIPTGNIVSNIITPSFTSGITGINSGNANVIITIADELFEGPISGQVTISNVNSPAMANGDWWYQATDWDQFQLFTDANLTTPVDGTMWPGYVDGGTAVGTGTYSNLTVQGGNVSVRSNDQTWQFDTTGNLTVPSSSSINAINDGGNLGAYLTLTPDIGLAKIAGRSSESNVIFTTADWTSASYTGTQIDFVDAPGLVTFFNNNRFNVGVNQTISINGGNNLPYTGYTTGASNAVTVYTSVTASPDPTTVTSINFYYQLESYVAVDYDDGALNINATNLDIIIDNDQTQGPDINIRSGDDILLQAKDKAIGTESEGGDINIYAGDGADDDGAGNTASTGGDIQIVGGNGGDGNSDPGASGGFTSISGGTGGGAGVTSTAGPGGYVSINGGDGGFDNGNTQLGAAGGYVEIIAGQSTLENTIGGNVRIISGQGGANAVAGSVQIITPVSGPSDGGTWTFDGTGNLILPSAGNINGTDGTYVRIQGLDLGLVRSGMTLNPGYGATQLESWDSQSSQSFTSADWATGEYIDNGGGSGEIVFTNTPAIRSFFDTIYTSGRLFYQVNGGDLLPSIGWGGGGNNINFYTAIPPATSPETVTNFTIYYSYKSVIEMDYDGGEMNITSQGLDVTIQSDQSIDMISNDIIRIQNSGNTSGVAIITDSSNTFNTWNFNVDGNVILPTISLGSGIDEQAIIGSQRKLIPPFRYSAVIDADNPTVVYNATNVDTTSMKVTMQIQHSGLGMEFFEVFATYTGSDTYYTVGNRVAPPTIDASTVVVGQGAGSTMEITVTINSGATTSWVTYDAVEFGIAVD